MADRCPLPATGPSCLGLVAFGRTMPPSCMFRPRGFSPPRRFPPPEDAWACCIPLPILGFIGFPRRARRASVRRGFPADATPSRAFPTRTAVPASPRAVALMSFPGCVPGATGSCATSRPCSVRAVRCDGPPLPAGQGPLLSWASRLGASRLSSHHGARRPKPTEAARADPLGGPCVTCMRTQLRVRRTCGVPVRAGRARPSGPWKGAVHEGRDLLLSPTGEPEGIAAPGTRGEPRGTTGGLAGPRHRLTTPDRPVARDALRLPGTRCCGAPHRCGTDLPKQAREASHHAGHRVRTVAGIGAHQAGHPRGAGRNATEPDAAGRRLRGPSSLRPPPCGEGRSCCDASLASETSSSLTRACGPQDVSGSLPCSGLGHGRTGLPRCHHARARTLQARASPPVTCALVVPPRCPPGGTTAVVYATSAHPLRGRRQRHPFGWSGGLRGPDASSPTSTCTGGLSDAVGRHGAPW
jgi:hypothetical protein